MIVKDPSEPYPFPTVPALEEATGADLIISPFPAPVAPGTLPLHVRNGALLVQVKRGLDLISSVGNRLWESLARMRETGARQWQCVLLTTGVFLPDPRTGECIVAEPTLHPDGHVEWRYLTHPQPRPYQAVESCLRHWTWYGGVVVQLPSNDVEGWARRTEARLLEKVGQSVKEIWPDPPEFDDPLVGLERVRDWRAILAAFPGIGPEKATALRKAMQEAGARDSLIQAIIWITDGLAAKHVPGWGKVLQQRVREVLGLEEWGRIVVEVENEYPPS